MQAKTIEFIGQVYQSDMPRGRPSKSGRSEFGKRLQFLRESAGMTQREVAAAIGIAQPSYVAWERRNIGLTTEQLKKLADVLGCEIEDFFLGEDQPRKRTGPAGRARQLFEQVSKLPRPRQKDILDVVEMLLRATSKKTVDEEQNPAAA
jgi:transcriptional regulator with XRE-family HTH domain